MDPWQNSQNTTPEHYVTSALLTRKLKGLAVQALKYHHPWFLSCVSNTFPAIETNKQNFSGNQKEKETFLYLCTDLGKKPPTLFSGHCLTTGKVMLFELDTTFTVAVPPHSFLQYILCLTVLHRKRRNVFITFFQTARTEMVFTTALPRKHQVPVWTPTDQFVLH